jgi:pimeloyl-ACP methyl ester carboxylesterase
MLRKSSLLVIPGAGHIAFEERPDICNRAMRDWLLRPLPIKRSVPSTVHSAA